MKKIKFKKVDTWSLYYTLAPVILKGLKKFRKSSRRTFPDAFESQKAWNEVLDAMIWSFKEIKKDERHSPLVKWYEKSEAGSLDPIPDAVLEAEKAYQERVRRDSTSSPVITASSGAELHAGLNSRSSAPPSSDGSCPLIRVITHTFS